MKAQQETLDPCEIIVEHFNKIARRIEAQTDEILQETCPNELDTNALTTLRDKQIEKLREIKEFNLVSNEFSRESFHIKWSYLINDKFNDYSAKIDQFKHDLILVDCVLVEDFTSKLKLALWIFPWFNNEEHVKFLK